MKDENERWYRTGKVADELDTSPHRVRELARVKLIEAKLHNGCFLIPGRELDRLKKEGLPAMPANTDFDGTEGLEPEEQEPADLRGGVRPVQRSRLVQDLYADPSPQLAKSKERLIRLEHNLEAKRLDQQIGQLDKAAREEEARTRQIRDAKEWRDGYIRDAVKRAPAEVCADLCERIDGLLSRVPAGTDVTAKVDALIEDALRPIRKREEQARVLQEHRQRIANAVRSIRLPWEATSDESEEAHELALATLAQNLPVGCTDRQLRMTLEEAIRPVVERIEQRKADAERKRLSDAHERRIEQSLSWLCIACLGATQEELADARQRVRTALEALPYSASNSEFSATTDQAVAPIKSAIEKRKESQRQKEATDRRTAALLSRVDTRLRELESDESIIFESYIDRCDLRDKVTQRIRPIVAREIAVNPSVSDADMKKRIARLVDKYHLEFCEEED